MDEDSKAKPLNFDNMGDRRLIMSLDETWDVWAEVFRRCELGTLHDIDSGCIFKERRTKSGALEPYKMEAINHNQLRNLQGPNDLAIRELAERIIADPPGVYLKRPKTWTRALPISTWCTRKKHKMVIAKMVADAAFHSTKDIGDEFFVYGVFKPLEWSLLKMYLQIDSSHMNYLLRIATTKWLNQQIGQGKNKIPPSRHLKEAVDVVANNDIRYNRVKKTVAGTVCRYTRREGRFIMENQILQGHTWVHYREGPAKLRFYEVGILDFRMFHRVKFTTVSKGYNRILESLNFVMGGVIRESVHTWMFIYNVDRKLQVNEMVDLYFSTYTRWRVAKYVYSAGEPYFTCSQLVKILYLQAEVPRPLNSDFVARVEAIQLVTDVESETLVTHDPMYASPDVYRTNHRNWYEKDELCHEIYIRFVDRFCRSRGTVVLVFSATKAAAACSVCAF